MYSFMRLAIGFLAVCLIIGGLIFFVSPGSLREAFRQHQSPVGQLDASHTLLSPGQPASHK